MKKLTVIFVILLACVTAFSQRPGADQQHLLVMQEGPALNYEAVAITGSHSPHGTTMGLPGDLEFDSKGHLWVVSRPGNGITTDTIVEFDENGKFIRSFGEGLFGNRPHGIHIDPENNIWISDGSSHTVVKLDQQGKVLLTLGTKGQAGNWDEAAGTRLLNEPNDVAIGRNGDIFLAQGHTPGADGRSSDSEVRQDGQVHQVLGRKRSRPGQVPRRTRNFHRCQRTALGYGSGELPHSDL